MVTAEKVRGLIEEVVRFGDDLEGFGLVDYELGFSEELVVAGLLGVLDLVEEQEEEDEGAVAGGSRGAGVGRGGGGGGVQQQLGHRKDVSMGGMSVSAAGMARSGV